MHPKNTYVKGSTVYMEMQPVNSTAILAAGYDMDNSVMAVQFISNLMDDQTYFFRPVPLSVWEAFLEAPSKGKFFHEHIRTNIGNPLDGGYEWNAGRSKS